MNNMVNYTIFDEDMNVIRTGACMDVDFQAQIMNAGELICQGIVESEPETLIENYTSKRKFSYPPIEEFADAMYWSSKGDDSKLKSYYAKCDHIKKKFPKMGEL